MAVRRTEQQKDAAAKSVARAKVLDRNASAQRADPKLAALTARQVIAEVTRRQEVAIGNTYAMALCLRELSRPERYRDELGSRSFEALLAAHPGLPSRMTCHKWLTVIGTFSEAEVRKLGGMEKAYELIRSARTTNGDPRTFLNDDARVHGTKVREVSARRLHDLLRGRGQPKRPKVSTEAAKKIARRLRTSFRRLVVTAQLRVHTHDSAPCVETHFPVKGATNLIALLRSTAPLGAT